LGDDRTPEASVDERDRRFQVGGPAGAIERRADTRGDRDPVHLGHVNGVNRVAVEGRKPRAPTPGIRTQNYVDRELAPARRIAAVERVDALHVRGSPRGDNRVSPEQGREIEDALCRAR
jgi:hypothetical protein